MKKKSVSRILLCIMVLLISAAFWGCGSGKSAESSENGNNSSDETAEAAGDGDASEDSCLVVGITQGISSLDPHDPGSDASTRSVLFNIYEGLVKAAPDGGITPAVAGDYTVSDDATVYTFTLREGITFHNGESVTVEDIKYSLERYAEHNSGSAFDVIEDISCPDDETVVLTLSSGDSEFIYNLTVAVIPESSEGNAETELPGTGPFMVKDYEEDQYLDLVRYDGYWDDVECVNEAEFRFIADSTSAYTMLMAGTIDMLEYLTYDQLDAVSDTCDIYDTTMMLAHGLYLNNDFEPFQDVRVRQAVNYAIDRDEINDYLFDGNSLIVNTFGYPSITAWYNPDTEGTYVHDTDKAAELLREAGYPDGFDLVITVPSNYSQHVDTAQIIVEQLAEVGIRATISETEWTTWLSDVYTDRNFEATVIGFDISTLSPASWYVRFVSDGTKNFVNFDDAEYDSLYEQAQATINDSEKYELYGRMQEILAEEAASVFIEDPADFVALNRKFTGYTAYPVSAVDLASIRPAQ